MADTLRHRGPDDSGIWTDPSAGMALGHRRLSILDLSAAGHQPMVSRCGRFVLAFNGEIYNHLDLRRDLNNPVAPSSSDEVTLGISWRGHSDTETLLACFVAWGIERTLQSIVGMFALALWDRETHTLTLSRDRVGEKPLYYGWQGNCFLFGSELKALKAHPCFCAEVDRGALVLLLRHNYVPAPYSIYEGIQKLLPGTYLQVEGAGASDADLSSRDAGEPARYWSFAQVAERGAATPFMGSDQDAVDELEQRLQAAVSAQMLADVPLGALLSGGLDSTTVTALMQSNSSQPILTFTVGFEDRQYDEATHARAVAKNLGTNHTELRLGADDALELIPQIPEMYDEPFADSSQLPTYLVMKLACQHVKVALSGDAGDELFGGYKRYLLAPKLWQWLGWMPQRLRQQLGGGLLKLPPELINRLLKPVANRSGMVMLSDKVEKLGNRLCNVDCIDDLYVSLVSEWPDPAGLVLNARLPRNLLDERASWPSLQDPVARMMIVDGLTYLPDDILVKVDRAAMAVSLETRAPFLDRDLIEFAWTLPMHMKIRDGQGKWIVRRLLDRYVPRELVERPKMGFGIPLDAWLRGPLRDWAESLLAEQRLEREGFFDPALVRATWNAHQAGSASFGYRLWSVLMFQAWLEANT